MLIENKIFHVLGLYALLFVFWLLLSGHYTLLLICFGLGSVTFVVFICLKMRLFECRQVVFLVQTATNIPYGIWLFKQIILANIDVCKRILDPKLPVYPVIVTVTASQKNEFFRAVYANSITLTPGTISMDVTGQNIKVHALSKQAADSLNRGEMDGRVSTMDNKRSCLR